MSSLTLYDDGGHKNILLEDFGHGQMVQANQHLVIQGGVGMILDPGGHKVYNRALSETHALLGRSTLKYIFLSHQDPDIVAAVNGWLMATDATAYASSLWLRFIPHFGLDSLVINRLKPIPDEGMKLDLGGSPLLILPAHFLHSPGNFSVFDPVSKILYSGDIGASLGMDYIEVLNFDSHVKYMEAFHRRYLASRKACRAWISMVRTLDVEMVAPQHGALFRGKELSNRFFDWLFDLDCGVDLLPESYQVPLR
jgi:flavorubredoxin